MNIHSMCIILHLFYVEGIFLTYCSCVLLGYAILNNLADCLGACGTFYIPNPENVLLQNPT